MSALQYIYTSSKKGYGVYSKSIGLSLDECKQITINSRYVRPQELTRDDIEDFSEFPVKLSRFKLRNHRWVVSQSVYLGKDNTGRQGNYFTHGLIFEKDEPMRSEILEYDFRTKLTEMEFNNTSPAPLSEISTFPLFKKDSIIQFINENKADVERLIDMFLESQQSNKKLVILDDNKNVVLWIKLLFSILPQNVMKNVQFSTYVERITNMFDIVGVYNTNMRFDNRLLVFERGVPAEASEFSKSIVHDYVSNIVRKEFVLFANSLKKGEVHDRIRTLYDLFSGAIVNHDVFFDILNSLPTNDENVVNEIIDFVVENKYSTNIQLDHFRILLRFANTLPLDEKYYSLIKDCAENGGANVVQEILKDKRIYTDEFLQFCGTDGYEEQLREVLLTITSDLLSKSMDKKYFDLMKQLLAPASEELLYKTKSVVTDMLNVLIKKNYDMVLADNPYDLLLELMGNVLSQEETRHFILQALNNAYGSDEMSFSNALNNAFRMLFKLKGFAELRKFMFPLMDKSKKKELKRCLDLIHGLVEHPMYGNVQAKDVDQFVFKYYAYYIDLLQRGSQKKSNEEVL